MSDLWGSTVLSIAAQSVLVNERPADGPAMHALPARTETVELAAMTAMLAEMHNHAPPSISRAASMASGLHSMGTSGSDDAAGVGPAPHHTRHARHDSHGMQDLLSGPPLPPHAGVSAAGSLHSGPVTIMGPTAAQLPPPPSLPIVSLPLPPPPPPPPPAAQVTTPPAGVPRTLSSPRVAAAAAAAAPASPPPVPRVTVEFPAPIPSLSAMADLRGATGLAADSGTNISDINADIPDVRMSLPVLRVAHCTDIAHNLKLIVRLRAGCEDVRGGWWCFFVCV
jgi:hypothetical protein